jgi:hypothetical protein
MLDGRDASAAHSARANLSAPSGALAAIAISFASSLVSSAAASGAPAIHLRGIARIDAHVARSHGKLVISGTVTDDVGAAAPHAHVTAEVSSEWRGAQSALPLAPEACSDGEQPPALERRDRAVALADASARFCIRLPLPVGRYVAHLEASAGGFVDGARIDLPVDLALEPVTLRFDPERPGISLDEESTPIDVVASTDEDGLTAAASNLPLSLSNEAGRVLGSATTDGTGRARFVVPGPLFGPAGKGELRVSFAGSAQAGASSYSATIERRARVAIAVVGAPEGRLPLATEGEEVAIAVVAKATCASHGCAGAPTGTIAVRVGEGDASRVLGAAPLAGGEARVVVRFAPPIEGEGGTAIRLDYVPDVPWFEPSQPLRLEQPLQPPGAWDKFLLALTGIGVVGWLAVGRLPRRWRASEPSKSKVAGTVASVELVKAGDASVPRWTGKIVDGHEGIPVPGARVAMLRPGFERAEVVVEAIADSDGAFVLAATGTRPGDRLVTEGRLHAAHDVPAPPFGEIRIALVSRRRALLDRLVAWARRKGRPYDATPEPTPGHVQRMARAGDAVRAWAEAIEHAAYSGEAIDAAGEAEVDRLGPGDARTPRGDAPASAGGDAAGGAAAGGPRGGGPVVPPGARRPVGGPGAR